MDTTVAIHLPSRIPVLLAMGRNKLIRKLEGYKKGIFKYRASDATLICQSKVVGCGWLYNAPWRTVFDGDTLELVMSTEVDLPSQSSYLVYQTAFIRWIGASADQTSPYIYKRVSTSYRSKWLDVSRKN